MNYLAHTLLSTKHIDYQVGNLLSDTLKGRAWHNSTALQRQGLSMHKRIDRFTDNHHVVHQAIDRLNSGYLRGVVIDITFDHFLSKHWARFVHTQKTVFTNQFYQAAESRLNLLPPKGQQFIERVIQYDILNAYETFDDLAEVLHKVNRRLSAKLLSKEAATDYLPRLADKYTALEGDFLTFFPDLIALFLQHSQASSENHYFRITL